MTILIISNEEMNGIMKIVKNLLKNLVYYLKVLAKQLKTKGGFFGMLLCTLGVPSLGNILIDTEVIWAVKRVIRAGKGASRVGQDF